MGKEAFQNTLAEITHAAVYNAVSEQLTLPDSNPQMLDVVSDYMRTLTMESRREEIVATAEITLIDTTGVTEQQADLHQEIQKKMTTDPDYKEARKGFLENYAPKLFMAEMNVRKERSTAVGDELDRDVRRSMGINLKNMLQRIQQAQSKAA